MNAKLETDAPSRISDRERANIPVAGTLQTRVRSANMKDIGSDMPSRASAEVFAHKLYAPQVYKGAIARTALLQRSFVDSAARLVVLQGPAGHGKTTVLQQLKALVEHDGYSTGWLSFDDADNDVRRFSVHLQALITLAVGDVQDKIDIDQPDSPQMLRRQKSDGLIDRLLSARGPVALFLDEFQVLTNPVLLSFCREIFERLPANTRVFVGSRSVPEIGLARMIVNNHALVFRADDLRFSRLEVGSFFENSKDLLVTPEEIESIYRHTEGWPAAVQLFRLSLASPEVRRSLDDLDTHRPRELAEYLTDSVLSLQEPRLQEFLLRTSLLTRLSAPLCAAVTGWSDTQEVLLGLERSGLFVRNLDSERRWFKFHGLFSSFLADQIRSQSRDAAMDVHRRAAAWHLQQGHFEDTVHHAIECGDFVMAADTLNVWASRLVADGALMTLERWFDRIPFEEVTKRVDLTVKVAYALVFLRRRVKLRSLRTLLEKRRGKGSAADTTSPDVVLSMAAMAADETAQAFEIIGNVDISELEVDAFGSFELGAASNLLAYQSIAAGDFLRVRERLTVARLCNDRAHATFSHGYTVGLAGVTALLQGHLGEALSRFRDGSSSRQAEIGKSFSSAALASCYVWGLYEAGQLELAESIFSEHHDIIAESALPDFIAVAFVAASRARDAAHGHVRGAGAIPLSLSVSGSDLLDEAEAISHANGWPRIMNLLNWERVRRAIVSGDLTGAQQLAKTIPASLLPDSWLPFSEELEGERLGRLRLELHSGDVKSITASLEAEEQRSQQRPFRRIKLKLFEAILQDRKGQKRASHQALQEALKLAESGGCVRVFVDEGSRVRDLLQEHYGDSSADDRFGVIETSVSRGFIKMILGACGIAEPSSGPAATTPIEPLTDREREILELLDKGVSNREIAARIFVSENTVKFHLKNIYSKLSVGSRLQAIATARRLGFIR